MNFADNWARVFVVITFLTFGEAQIIGGIVPLRQIYCISSYVIFVLTRSARKV